MTDATPKARMRHCWYCGKKMGVIENKHYDRYDTCGARECEREARYQFQAEHDQAHEQLDRDMDWK